MMNDEKETFSEGIFWPVPNATNLRLNNNKTKLAVGNWQKTAPNGAKRF